MAILEFFGASFVWWGDLEVEVEVEVVFVPIFRKVDLKKKSGVFLDGCFLCLIDVLVCWKAFLCEKEGVKECVITKEQKQICFIIDLQK